MNLFREKLKSGKPMLGTHVNLTDHRICEILGAIGFDYIWMDMEHISTSFKDMETNLMACRATGTPSLVRICWNDIPHTKRVLEAGPDAVVFPMINSVEEAQRAIDTCIYPPDGKRGFGPFRAVGYGLESTEDYIRQGHKEMCRFVQVETKAAVECMEETAKIPYLDGFILGPMDLSGSIGKLGQTRDREVDALIDLAIRKAHDAGLPIGLSTGGESQEEIDHWLGKGLDMLSCSTDVQHILRGSQQLLARMKESAAQSRP